MLPNVGIIRKLVILNECEGSQSHAEQRYFALLSMTGTAGLTAISLLKEKAPVVVLFLFEFDGLYRLYL